MSNMDVTLRRWQMADAPAIQRYADNPRVSANLTDGFPCPYTLTDAEDFMRSCAGDDESRVCNRAICVGGEPVGGVGITLGEDVYRMRAELGYWLAEPFWGKGITSRAVEQMCAWAFANYNIVRIFAVPFAYNTASCRVLEKNGFVREALMRDSVVKNGKVIDSFLYARFK